MRNEWYGDHRDVVKWGVLLHLARQHRLGRILQVAYLTKDKCVPGLVSGSRESRVGPVAPEVLAHFRDIRHITGLGNLAGVEIEVFDRDFSRTSRVEYTAALLDRLHSSGKAPLVVFLDPDTGLGSATSPSHITAEEVTALWNAVPAGSVLVLYQHAARVTGWVEDRRKAFQKACRGAQIEQFRAETKTGARDVAFYVASAR